MEVRPRRLRGGLWRRDIGRGRAMAAHRAAKVSGKKFEFGRDRLYQWAECLYWYLL